MAIMLIRLAFIAALGVTIVAGHAAEVEWRPEKNIEIISNFPVKQITVVDPIPGYADHVK